MSDFTEETRRALRRKAATYQSEGRIPGVYAAVSRAGRIAYGTGIGSSDLDRPDEPPTEHTRYQIASITKTFTAVAVMALRDEGKLSLDDSIEDHVPESSHRRLTIRQMLSHSTGMQREPVGDIWDTLEPVEREELLSGWNIAERVLKPHHRFHYSNLVFAMLGEVVSRLDGRSWADSVQTRILDPLELRDTTLEPSDADCKPYYVPPFTDVPIEEPVLAHDALAPAGGLRSTAADLATWLGFLADPTAEVLSPDTVDEMCQPQIMSDPEGWQAAWGLGLQLVRHQGRVLVGHPGGMPGQVTCALVERESSTGGIALVNSTTPPDIVGFAAGLASYAIENEPVEPGVWRPGPPVPDELVGVLGRWYAEGSGHDFSVRKGRLEARGAEASKEQPPSVFVRLEADLYRTESGRETGELLRISRNPDGTVSHLNWATYRLTREPLHFGGWL